MKPGAWYCSQHICDACLAQHKVKNLSLDYAGTGGLGIACMWLIPSMPRRAAEKTNCKTHSPLNIWQTTQ